MSLFWLASGALGLLALGFLPLLAHLVKKKPRQRIPFGPMMLLKKLPRKMRKRRRLEDILLLILRILCIVCMILAVSRPEIRYPSPLSDVQNARAIVLVIDNSLSMEQAISKENDDVRWTALAQAKKDAIRFVKELPDGVSLGLVVVGGEGLSLSGGLVDEKSILINLLLDIQQSNGRTDLSGGLRLARQMLDGKGGEVFVFTDEAGENTVTDTSEEIRLMSSQNVTMSPRIVRADPVRNVAIASAKYDEGPEGGLVRFTANNYGMKPIEVRLTAHLPGATEAIPTFIELEASEELEPDGVQETNDDEAQDPSEDEDPTLSSEVGAIGKVRDFVTVPRVSAGGIGRLSLEDSGLTLDNDYFFHLPRIGASRVLVIDGEEGATAIKSEVYFLVRALAPDGGRKDMIPDVVNNGGIGALKPDSHRVVFMANESNPSLVAGPLTEFVRNGGGLVISLGGNVSPERYNTALSDLLPAKLKRLKNLGSGKDSGIPTSLPDISTPLFKPFARGGLKSFSKTKWSRIITLEDFTADENTTVLLSLENGMPLLIEKKVGKGKVLLLTSSIHTRWGTFPIQSAFMPFIQELVAYLGGAGSFGGIRKYGTVGTQVKVPVPENSSDLLLTGPNGAVGVQVKNGYAFFTPTRAGAYKLYRTGAPPLAWIAVNSDLYESDIRPPLKNGLQQQAMKIDLERYQKKAALSPWLVLAALLAALFQSALFRTRRNDDDS